MNLVTGASGFLGRHLVEALVERDENVRVLIRQTSESEHLQHPLIEICFGNLLDYDSLTSVFKGVTRVFHCAALADYRTILR